MGDIHALLDVVDTALDGFEAVVAASADGSINFMDIPKFLGLGPELYKDLGELKDIPSEIANLAPEDAQTVLDHVMARLSLEAGSAKNVADAILKALIANYAVFLAIKNKGVAPAPISS